MHELMHGLGPAQITVGGKADDRAAGAEGHVQHDRGGQGRHLGPLGAAAPRRSRQAADSRWSRRCTRRFWRRVPIDPVWHQRGARPRHRHPVELPAGPRRLHRRAGRHVRGGRARRSAAPSRADARHHDAAGATATTPPRRRSTATGVVRPEVQRVLDKLNDVPVDIAPKFTTAAALEQQFAVVRASKPPAKARLESHASRGAARARTPRGACAGGPGS